MENQFVMRAVSYEKDMYTFLLVLGSGCAFTLSSSFLERHVHDIPYLCFISRASHIS